MTALEKVDPKWNNADFVERANWKNKVCIGIMPPLAIEFAQRPFIIPTSGSVCIYFSIILPNTKY